MVFHWQAITGKGFGEVMPIVTEHLLELIAKQVEGQGLVVWYDPERAYDAVVADLRLPQTTVVRYNGSFFELRRQIDHLLGDGQPPRLVVYVPLERMETHSALIELDCAGVVMQPRQQPPICNTRLSVVARNALKPILAEDQVAEIERQVEAGKLSLADLNSLADKGKGISTGVLALIFGTANPQEVALALLSGDQYDWEIGKKSAEKELRHLLQVSFDIELPSSEGLSGWRGRLGRHVLLTDLFAALKGNVPSSLTPVPVAQNVAGVDACVRLARAWRNGRDVREGYMVAAARVEREFSLGGLALAVEQLTGHDTFECAERALLAYVEEKLFAAATPTLLQLAERRRSRFWADMVPAIQARWALVSAAAEVLLEAERVGNAMKTASGTVAALVKAYAGDDDPWCLLDTHHRQMESRKYNFEFSPDVDHQGLEKLIVRAEQRYAEVGSQLARQFITAFWKAEHPVKGLMWQRDIFETRVRPHVEEGKVAYLWVDALRFEMARELCHVLRDDFELEIQPAIGMIPTVTEIGMAALLPGAHGSARVVAAREGKLGLEIDGRLIKDRKDRVAFLKEHAGVSVFDAKLEELLPKPARKLKDGIANAQLILITSQEIDELGEQDNMAQGRLQIDGVLGQLRRGLKVLGDLGIGKIVLASDHGHLFADEIGEDMKIDPPGGQTADLHRRVWVGVGGSAESSFMRAPLSSLGVESELDIATPWTFACFKCKGGARAYFHGGLSPQELIVPVIVLTPLAKKGVNAEKVEWELIPGSSKLTTRFFSVQVGGKGGGLFKLDSRRIRVEIRAKGKVVCRPVSASYGFGDATGEVLLRPSESDKARFEPNTITVMLLEEEIGQKTVAVALIDAATGVELAVLEKIEVAIAF